MILDVRNYIWRCENKKKKKKRLYTTGLEYREMGKD
jgi:hypothetical protein